MILRIGTRGSRLALAQSRWVKQMVEKEHPETRVDLVLIKTTGDRILHTPLSSIGGKGLFVKEIEQALMEGKIDVAVHSMKDVPADLPDGLILAMFPEREDFRDAFISPGMGQLEHIHHGARIGTSSLRRSAQLLHFRPDIHITPLRGNVDTRIKKLESGEVNGIILAAAGLKRLGLSNRVGSFIPEEVMLPAVGQGALGLETREEDDKTISLLSFLNHRPTEIAIRAERAFLKKLEGGCQVPIAGLAYIKEERIYMQGMVGALDGSTIIREEITGSVDDPGETGNRLAGLLLDSGAGDILTDIYG